MYVVKVVRVEAATVCFQGLGDDIPPIYLAVVSVHDFIEVSCHCSTKLCGVGNVEQKVGIAAARDKAVAFDHHVIVVRECD